MMILTLHSNKLRLKQKITAPTAAQEWNLHSNKLRLKQLKVSRGAID